MSKTAIGRLISILFDSRFIFLSIIFLQNIACTCVNMRYNSYNVHIVTCQNQIMMERVETMPDEKKYLREHSPYSAVLTREQFLFYETRTTAKLLCEGLSKDEIIERIVKENLFQYPTEKSIRRMALACIRRLESMENESLIAAISTQPSDVAKQICLYAMMRQYRLVWDFMLTVVGEKYRTLDMSFGKMEVNQFFMRLQEQDDWVATWSDATITKLKQVLRKILVENQYLDSVNADRLNRVLISPLLESAIRGDGQEIVLPAFNCFY